MTAVDISDRVGVSSRRVRQSINFLLGTRRVTLRTEIVRSLSSWPVSAFLFINAPAANRNHLTDQLSRLEDVRAVFSVLGPYNLAIAVWARTLDDVARLEALLEKQLPNVRVLDRAVVIRAVKLAGNLLDDTGRPYDYVAPSLPAQG